MALHGSSFYQAASPSAEPEPDLYQWLSRKGLASPHQPAIISLWQSAHHLSNLLTSTQADNNNNNPDHFQWSFGQLHEATGNLGQWLTAQIGNIKDCSILVAVPNSAEWGLFFFTAVRFGIKFVPINPSVFHRREDAEQVCQRVNAKAIIVGNLDHANTFSRNASKLPVQLVSGDADQSVPSGWEPLSSISAVASQEPIRAQAASPNQVACIQFTSGSTNLPKACAKTSRNVQAEINGYHSMYGSAWEDAGTRHMQTSTPFGVVCYLGCTNAWQAGGAVVIPTPAFDMKAAVHCLGSNDITHAWFFPSYLLNLLDGPELQQYKHSRLKTILVSGDSVPREALERASQLLRARIILHWGMTEGAPLFGWQKDEPTRTSQDGIQALGRPLPGSKAKICLEGTHDPVAVGKRGELHVSSDMFVDGYMGGAAKEDFYDDDGRWFKTGDLAEMDESGAVYFKGRSKDVMKRQGTMLLPIVFETWLRKRYNIESNVFGLPDRKEGELPTAVVKMPEMDDRKRSEMIAACEEDFGYHMGLSHIVSLGELGRSEWPYGSTRKVSKKDLKDLVTRQLAI